MTEDKYKVLVALLIKGMVCQVNTRIPDDPFMKDYEDSLYIENPDEIYAFLRMNEPELYYPKLMKAIRQRKYVEQILEEERRENNGESDRSFRGEWIRKDNGHEDT